MKNKEFSKELLESVYGDLFNKPVDSKRKVKMFVSFNNEESAEKWLKEFNELIKQEMLKDYETSKSK